jgi:molecular chaperone DnaK (HSP70)
VVSIAVRARRKSVMRFGKISCLICCAAMLSGCARSKSTREENEGFRVAYSGKTLVESVGIETLGGVFTPVIKKGSPIPVTIKEIFSTAADNQSSVMIHVLAGNAELAKDNRTIGQFQIVGIRPAPRGVPQIEVAYVVDDSGALTVKAKDLDTGKENEIQVLGVSPKVEK